jgi:hypothetical protein
MSGRHKSKRKKEKHSSTYKHSVGGDELNNEPDRVQVRGNIETSFPPKFAEKYQTGQDQQTSRDGVKLKVEIATLVLVFAYTTVALWQGCSNKHSADAAKNSVDLARKTAHLDQRAWLSVKVAARPAEIGKGNRNTAIFSNHGKTYALNVQACKVIDQTNNDPPANPVKEPPSFHVCSKPDDWHPHGVIAPNSDVEVDLGSMFVTNGIVTYPFDKKLVDAINSGRLVQWQYGEVRYEDVFGCHHWVRYCYDRPPSSDGSPARFVICNGRDRNAVDVNECDK